MAAPKGNQYAKGNPGGGRPSLFNPKQLEQIKKALEAGFTDYDLSVLLGVEEKTINNWKHEHEDFVTALKESKLSADKGVERSLYERAKGYVGKAVKVMRDGTLVEHTEYYPPDTTACIFWLKNRQPAHWRDRVEQVVDDRRTVLSSEPLTDEQFANKYELEEPIK